MDHKIEALAGYLDSLDFDYFCTFTTRKPVSVAATRRIAERVAGRFACGIDNSMFWAAEKFDVREGFHFHALMKMKWVTPTDVWGWYFPRYGRCQIKPSDGVAASVYCAKYVTKKVTDYDIYLPGMSSPPGRNPLEF